MSTSVQKPIIDLKGYRNITGLASQSTWDALEIKPRANALAEEEKNFISNLNKSVGNTPYKPESSEDDDKNFKFRNGGLLGNRVTIKELESLKASDVAKFKKLLQDTNVDTLVEGLTSNKSKVKADSNQLTDLIFKFAVDLKEDEIDAVIENLNFGVDSDEANNDLRFVIEDCRNKANEIIEKKTSELSLNTAQTDLRAKVLEFLKFSDDIKESEAVNTQAKLAIIKDILFTAGKTDDLKTFNRMDFRPNGQVVYDAQLFREINTVLGHDPMAAKLTENFVDAFHDIMNYSEKKLYNHAYDSQAREVNQNLLEIKRDIFDKVKDEKFSDLTLVDYSSFPPFTPPLVLNPIALRDLEIQYKEDLENFKRDTLNDKFTEVIEATSKPDRLKAYKELKVSLLRDILFPDLNEKDADKLQTNAIKRFVEFENQYRKEIDKSKKLMASSDNLIVAIDSLDKYEGLENDFHPVNLGVLVEGSDMLVNDEVKEKILKAYNVASVDDLTDEHKAGYVDICLGDIQETQRSLFKDKLKTVKRENKDFFLEMESVMHKAKDEIFAANAYGNREIKVLSNLEANIDRFMFSYDDTDTEPSVNEESAKFLGTLAVNELLGDFGTVPEIDLRLAVIKERTDLEVTNVRKEIFGDRGDKAPVRLAFINSIEAMFDDIATNPNAKTDDGRSTTDILDELKEKPEYKTLMDNIRKYQDTRLNKKSAEAFYLEREIMQGFLQQYYHFISEYDYEGLDARDFMDNSVIDLIERQNQGVDIGADPIYASPEELFDGILLETKQAVLKGVSPLLEKFLDRQSKLEQDRDLVENINFDPYQAPETRRLDKFYEQSMKQRIHGTSVSGVADYLKEILGRFLESFAGQRISPLHSNVPVARFDEDSPFFRHFDTSVQGLNI